MKRHLFHRRRGANALEFALLMPLYLMLIGGMIDFGWWFYNQSALDSSLHLGCRYGSTLDPDTDRVALPTNTVLTRTRIENLFASSGVACVNCAVTVEPTLFDVPRHSLRCTIANDYTPLFGLTGGSRRLVSKMVMRYEFQREAP